MDSDDGMGMLVPILFHWSQEHWSNKENYLLCLIMWNACAFV